MKKLLLLVGLSFFILNSNAQESEPITIDEKGYVTQNDVRLKVKTILKIVEPNIAAYQEVKRGKSRRTWGYVLSCTSGVFTSMAILEEEDRGTAIAAAGITFVGGVVLFVSSGKKIMKGIEIYNASLSFNSSPTSGSLKLGFTNNGIGLTFTF